MSLHRRAAKRDACEPEVIEAFEKGGATVEPVSKRGVPDLLVGYLGVNHLVECKTGNARLNEDQQTWHRAWVGEKPEVARNAAQARKLLRIWSERRPTLSTVLRAEHAALQSLEDDLAEEGNR